MARFLFCPMPFSGEVNPTVPIALALQDRGHEVAYIIGPRLEAGLASAGLRSFVAPRGMFGDPPPEGETSVFRRRFVHPLGSQMELLDRIFARFHPDVVVDAVLPFAPRLFCEQRGLLHASVHSATHPIPTGDALFPFGWGEPPPRDPWTLVAAQAAQRAEAERDRQDLEDWNAVRAAFGLPADDTHPFRAASSPYLALLPCAPAYEYPRTDLPAQFWFVGRLAWEPPGMALPERLRVLPSDPRVVFVCQGTSFNADPVVLRLAFQALAAEAVQVVGAVARAFSPSEFAPLPGNVLLESFVPFSGFMQRARVFITHAGAGAVHAAFAAGVPVLAMPLAIDQFEVASRVQYSGAGLRLDVERCDPRDVAVAVRRLLDEPSFGENARRLRDAYQALGGPSFAASLLEKLARTGAPVERELGHSPWSSASA